MKFSIIIPIYNVEAYLKDCLDSVLSQTYTDWEAICVNDGSTDRSGAILTEYAATDNRIIVKEQPNRGAGAARNTGIALASGEYIFFLDSDDTITTNALNILEYELCHHQIYTQEKIDMIAFTGSLINIQGITLAQDNLIETFYSNGMEYYNANALKKYSFAFVSPVLRIYRTDFLRVHKLHFLEGLCAFEDNAWIPIVCYYARNVKVINQSIYVYRMHTNSVMTKIHPDKRKSLLKVVNYLATFFVNRQNIDKTIVYRALTHHYQAVFQDATPEDDKELLPLVDWSLYKSVSRTKLRHRLQYAAMRISPKVYRYLNQKIK